MDNPKASRSKRKRNVIDVDKATASVDTADIRNQALTHKKAKKAKKTAAVNHELANTVSDSEDIDEDGSTPQQTLPSLSLLQTQLG